MRIKNIFLLFFCLIAFVQCNDKDEYFDEPNWLEKPIYQVLQDKGRFTNYLKCVDRTFYAPVLKGGGYYTVFAPNDEAFAAYLNEKGYSSVDAIPQEEVNALVGYSMLFNRWTYSHLGDVFVGEPGDEYQRGRAVKRQTNYYETIYQDPEFDNNWVIDQNTTSITYSQGVNNYKYVPVITSAYLNYAGLAPSDYAVFFPEATFSGTNVYNAEVIAGTDVKEADGMPARNGIAHELSAVVPPIPNMDKFLLNSQYSEFKKLLDFKTLAGGYAFKNYVEDLSLADHYREIMPSAEPAIDKVYVKSYSTDLLSFSPALEQFVSQTFTTEMGGYTLFVPTNEALSAYVADKFKYYGDLRYVSQEAIRTLINTHMVEGMIWPSEFRNTQVSTGEYLNGEGPSGPGFSELGVSDPKFTSNGFIYTIDFVIRSKLFETVYSHIFLNPAYTMMDAGFIRFFNSSLRENLMRSKISGYGTDRYTVLLLSDELLKNDGFVLSYDNSGTPVFTNSGVLSGTANDRISRLLRMHLFQGYESGSFSSEIQSFEGDGDGSRYDGWTFRTTVYGDLIRYKNNQIQAVGNLEDKTFVNVTPVETFDNGTVYGIDGLLQFSPRNTYPTTEEGWRSRSIWEYLQKAKEDNPLVANFVDYVEAALKNPDSNELSGINEENFHTILMLPTASMNNARRDGVLPELALVNSDAFAKEKAAKFLRAHFITGKIYADDGLENYLYPYNAAQPNRELAPTALRINNEGIGLINQRTYIQVSKNGADLVFEPQDVKDETTGEVLVKAGTYRDQPIRIRAGKLTGNKFDELRSNRMAGRAVLHELISGYVVYEEKVTTP